jgi:hypothetical protein
MLTRLMLYAAVVMGVSLGLEPEYQVWALEPGASGHSLTALKLRAWRPET